MTTSNMPSSDIDSYLNNIKTIKSSKEARKYQFVRLVSFKEFMKNTSLPTTIMANLGFYYDPKTSSIKCCECEFKYTNLKSANVRPIVIQHYDQYPKCANIEKQKEFLNEFLEHQSMDFDDNQEKVRKFMEKKENRLKSFENIVLILSIPSLVENGFYVDKEFNSNSALIKINCVFCEYECIVFKNYHLNSNYEDPIEEHRMKSPNCQIFNDSIDLGKNETSNRKSVNDNQILKIIDSIQDNQMGKSILYNNPENFDILKNVLSKTLNAVCDKPFHPGYATEQLRLESFRNWPLTLAQRPDELAKAGFYYYGCKDQVKCFFCNGGLRNWDPTDEPIWEHARWFPKCSYIRQLMGAKFLDDVKERYKDQDSGFTDDIDDTPEYYDLTTNDRGGAATNTLNNRNLRSGRDNPPAVNQQQTQTQTRFRAPSPRTINSRLDLPIIRKVMDLGIKRNTLKQVIEKKLKEEGKDYENTLELVKACMRHEENAKRLQEQFKQTFHLYISNIPDDVKDIQIQDLINKKFHVQASIKNFNGIILVCLKEEDLDKLDEIVNELNEKVFPGSKSTNKIIVKKTGDKEDIKAQSNVVNFEKNVKKAKIEATGNTTKKEQMMEINDTNMDSGQLQEQFETLKKERQCVICYDRQKNIMFLPCAHLAACVECSVSLSTCPMCRTKVQATVRTYS